LKWQDFDFERRTVMVVRAAVQGNVEAVKA
jgi:hypothetical protein